MYGIEGRLLTFSSCLAASEEARSCRRSSVLALRVPSAFRIPHQHSCFHLSLITIHSSSIRANMAAAADTSAGAQADLPRRKPPRVSDLPLSSSKRASIDSLLHTFKKKGQFDELRKNTFAQFDHGVCSCLLVLHPPLSNTIPQADKRLPG
jgi:hypothetical protein